MVIKNKQIFALSLLRIALGWMFLWAFLDKLFGLGFSTMHEKAWIYGGSPTLGFLKTATYGPFASAFQAIAGNVFVDILFMLALLFIGISLIGGFWIRSSSLVGAVLVFLMWLARLPPKNNPIIDEHIIYLLIFVLFLVFDKPGYNLRDLMLKWKERR